MADKFLYETLDSASGLGFLKKEIPDFLKNNLDGLVKSRKTDFLPQYIGIMQDDGTICCGQNKMLGLFTRPSILILNLNYDLIK
jgi:hypothetical protein